MEDVAFAIGLLLIALVLLVVEIFIPSAGAIFFLAVACLGGSIYFAWRSWWETSPWLWWSYVASLFVLIPAAVGTGVRLLPRTRIGREVLLEPPDLEEMRAAQSGAQSHFQELLGQRGHTQSLHCPGGLSVIAGERVHSESEGIMIDPGEEVVVVAIKGYRVVVRRAADIANRPDDSRLDEEFDADEEGSESTPLDFELPPD